jgi:hypothetical protein
MPALLRHDNVEFADETICVTGNAFVGCRFERCTLQFIGGVLSYFDQCTFANCVWHFNVVISDTSQTDALLELINRCVYRSVTPGGDSDTETTE